MSILGRGWEGCRRRRRRRRRRKRIRRSQGKSFSVWTDDQIG
jgi:hypothetical protein